jgi:hypothetical protein
MLAIIVANRDMAGKQARGAGAGGWRTKTARRALASECLSKPPIALNMVSRVCAGQVRIAHCTD